MVFSDVPIELKNVSEEDIDKELMRVAIMAEFDAINMYEQMANITENEDLKTILLDIAQEEKVHVAMFQTVLMEVDNEYLKVMVNYSLAKE
ncbi:Rubrerythrin [Methanolobus vulcani]|jgi:rubrerythrin|uniref:Rubrerythrin n=1 Tax=Methanolobus vulcani TaxID=38026 RepID=A0A7Z7FCC7_9EURY|nr:demethoxyubiquinone hydroxylase family protein [Methanolobus vulcani]SDF73327.1 Rubrerythrin [Methanolobus vulcani]